MDDNGYNGWTNHATWCVNLHLSNDEGTSRYVSEMSERAAADSEDVGYYNSRRQAYVGRLARMLEAYVEATVIDPVDDSRHLLTVDLLRSALGDVDWLEIAGNWNEDIDLPEPDAGE